MQYLSLLILTCGFSLTVKGQREPSESITSSNADIMEEDRVAGEHLRRLVEHWTGLMEESERGLEEIERSMTAAFEKQRAAAVSKQNKGAPEVTIERQEAAAVSKQNEGAPEVTIERQGAAAVSKQNEGAPEVTIERQGAAAVSKQNKGAPEVTIERQGAAAISKQNEGAPEVTIERPLKEMDSQGVYSRDFDSRVSTALDSERQFSVESNQGIPTGSGIDKFPKLKAFLETAREEGNEDHYKSPLGMFIVKMGQAIDITMKEWETQEADTKSNRKKRDFLTFFNERFGSRQKRSVLKSAKPTLKDNSNAAVVHQSTLAPRSAIVLPIHSDLVVTRQPAKKTARHRRRSKHAGNNGITDANISAKDHPVFTQQDESEAGDLFSSMTRNFGNFLDSLSHQNRATRDANPVNQKRSRRQVSDLIQLFPDVSEALDIGDVSNYINRFYTFLQMLGDVLKYPVMCPSSQINSYTGQLCVIADQCTGWNSFNNTYCQEILSINSGLSPGYPGIFGPGTFLVPYGYNQQYGGPSYGPNPYGYNQQYGGPSNGPNPYGYNQQYGGPSNGPYPYGYNQQYGGPSNGSKPYGNGQQYGGSRSGSKPVGSGSKPNYVKPL